jgi:hypothetical protein
MAIPFLPAEPVSIVLNYLDVQSLFIAQQLNSMWWHESHIVLRSKLQKALANRELWVYYDFVGLPYWSDPGIFTGYCRKTNLIEFTLASRLTLQSRVIWTEQRPRQTIEPALRTRMPCIPQVQIPIQHVVNWIMGRRKTISIDIQLSMSLYRLYGEGYLVPV